MLPTPTSGLLDPATFERAAGMDPSVGEVSGPAPLPDVAWDAFACSQPGDTVLQTTAWSAAKCRLGYAVAAASIHDGERLCGGAQIVVRRFGPLGAVGYVARGPLLAGRDEPAIERGLERVEEVARAAGVSLLVVQPPEGGEPIEAVLDRRDYHTDALEVAPTATMRIDLRQDEERILAGMSATRRRHLRRIGKDCRLTLRAGGAVDLELFQRLHAATAARQGFEPMSLRYLRAHWEALAPQGWVRLVLAELDGEAVAGLWLTAFGDSLIYRLGGWTGAAAELRPNEACHWWAMRSGRQEGFRWYDLGGISRSFVELMLAGAAPSAEMQQSPAWFKRQFGGELVLLPQPRLKVFNPVTRPLVHAAMRLARRSPLMHRIAGWVRGHG